MIIQVDEDTKVEFPDDTPEEEIQKALKENFPPRAEDIAAQLKVDENFVPSPSEFALLQGWKDENAKGFIESAVEAVPELVGQAGRGLLGVLDVTSWFDNGKNPLATLGEAGAQSVAQLYNLVANSTNPNSYAFQFKDLITGDGTFDSQYKQFLKAREAQKWQNQVNRGEKAVLPGSEERANLALATDLSVLVDPTLMFAPAKALALTGKLGAGALKAAEAVNKVESIAGKIAAKGVAKAGDAVSATGKAVSGVAEAGLRKVGETIDGLKIPGGGLVAGFGAAHIPGVAMAGGAYAGAKAANIGGELLAEAARTASGPASRLSTLEQLAASPTLSGGARTVASAMLPLDPALQVVGAAARGGLEGAAVGGAMGYYGTGTAEGAGQGAGAGFGLGAVGGVVGKGIEKVAGVGRRDAILNEVGKEISTLPQEQQPMAAKLFDRMASKGQHEAIAELIDVRRWLGDKVDFRYLDNATAPEVFAKQFPGQKYVQSQGFAGIAESGKPAVFINADNVKPGTGFHEALHGAVRTAIGEEFGTKMANWAQANMSPEKIKEYVQEYLSRASKSDQARLKPVFDTNTPEGLRMVLEEVSADSFSRFLRSSEHRDYLLRGKRDWAGAVVGLAKDTIGQLTDRLGKTDYGTQRGFEKIAKELINAQRIIAREEIKSGPLQRPVDLAGLSGKDLEAWAAKHGQIDVLKRDAQGNTIGIRSAGEVNAERSAINANLFKLMHEHAVKAGAKKAVDGSIRVNRRMLEKYKADIPKNLYDRAVGFLDAKDQGLVIKWDSYFPDQKRKADRSNTSIPAIRHEETRTGIPYELKVSEGGGLSVTILDMDKIQARADDFLGREGMLKPWKGSKMDAMADLRKYINNLGSQDSVPSEVLFGKEKRDILYKIVGTTLRKGQELLNPHEFPNDRSTHQAATGQTIGALGPGNNTTPTVTLNLDRMGAHGPNGDKLNFTTGAYHKSQVNWNPAQRVGETEVITSDKGFKIIHGTRWRLYDSNEKLVGIYSTEAEAAKKADLISR